MSHEEPLRILHLASSWRWTGVAEPATSLARHHQSMGCATWLGAVPGASFEEKVKECGVPFAREIDLSHRINPVLLVRDWRAIRSFIQTNRIDVVHSHLIHDHWLAALAIRGMAARRPVLVRTVHRLEKMARDPIHRWLFEQRTPRVITVSSEQERMILAAYPRLEGRLALIFGGVDPDRFKPGLPGAASVRADMGERPETPVAGIVAHLGFNRGHEWLLEAAREVVHRLPEGSIWIVGQGELKYDLRQRVLDPKFKCRVVMAGYRSDDLPETYSAMNAALLLGLGSEGSARAALEAMASGCPVIGVRKGSLIDMITDGVDGILVAEGDVPGLADALVRLLGNPEEAHRMGVEARRKVMAQFTERRRAERTLELYRAAQTDTC